MSLLSVRPMQQVMFARNNSETAGSLAFSNSETAGSLAFSNSETAGSLAFSGSSSGGASTGGSVSCIA